MRRHHRLKSILAQAIGDGNGARAILFRTDANTMQQLATGPVLEYECRITTRTQFRNQPFRLAAA